MATGKIEKDKTIGMGIRATLGSGDNLNNLNKRDLTGFYYVTANVTNSPDVYSILLNVCNSDNGFTEQILFRSADRIYMRTFAGNPIVWSAWKHVGFSA